MVRDQVVEVQLAKPGVQRVLVEGASVRSKKQPRTLPPGMEQLTGRTGGDHIVDPALVPGVRFV